VVFLYSFDLHGKITYQQKQIHNFFATVQQELKITLLTNQQTDE
jgi:hypothetical protein